MTDKDKIKKYEAAKEIGTDETPPDKERTAPAPEAEAAEEDSVDLLKQALETEKQKAAETHDRFLRVSAEFENYKKRTQREISEFRKYANESLIKEVLPVVDNLERAIASSTTDEKAKNRVVEGVDLTLKEILKIFEKFGVKPIESLGKTFDPSFHQAVMQEESLDKPDNTVLNELNKGYMIHERLLRPAMVVVSKAASTGADENDRKENG